MTRKEICLKCVNTARDGVLVRNSYVATEINEKYDEIARKIDGKTCVFLGNRISIDTVVTMDNKRLFIGDDCRYRLELLMAQE